MVQRGGGAGGELQPQVQSRCRGAEVQSRCRCGAEVVQRQCRGGAEVLRSKYDGGAADKVLSRNRGAGAAAAAAVEVQRCRYGGVEEVQQSVQRC